MKKVALISSFCDTEEKVSILSQNIDTIKNFSIDVILISPFALPKSIINKCDYFFKTKDNPVLDWPEHSMTQWMDVFLDSGHYRIYRTYPDYGFASLSQVKQLSNVALSLNYDQFFHIIYDVKIDDNVIDGLLSDKICNVYPSKRGQTLWHVGLHFMIFDRRNLIRFISNIHLDSYLKNGCFDAFAWLGNLNSIFPYTIETTPVEDKIFYYENYDLFNYSNTDKFSVFIVKDDETKETIKFLFYNVKEPKSIEVNINGNITNFLIENYKLLDLNVNQYNLNNVGLICDNESFDFTEIVNKIKHNSLRKV
jgi:hypothetical protein